MSAIAFIVSPVSPRVGFISVLVLSGIGILLSCFLAIPGFTEVLVAGRLYFGTTIRTVPNPLQNRQRSPSMSFPEPEHSWHLATIWYSASAVSGTLPGLSFTTSAR